MKCDKQVAMDVNLHFRKFRATCKTQELNGHVSRKLSKEICKVASCHLFTYMYFMTFFRPDTSNLWSKGLMFQNREYFSPK